MVQKRSVLVICWFSGAQSHHGCYPTRISTVMSHPSCAAAHQTNPWTSLGRHHAQHQLHAEVVRFWLLLPQLGWVPGLGTEEASTSPRIAASMQIRLSFISMFDAKISHFSTAGCCCFAEVYKTTYFSDAIKSLILVWPFPLVAFWLEKSLGKKSASEQKALPEQTEQKTEQWAWHKHRSFSWPT